MAFAVEQAEPADEMMAVASRSGTGARHAPTPALDVEFVQARAMIAFQPAWSDLVARALEPNAFLDPAFALPLLQHVRFAKRPGFLLAWESDGPASFGKLVGLLPMHIPTGLQRLARGFHHPQVTLGTPLLDRERGAEAFAAMVAWLARNHPGLAALVLMAVPTQGGFCQALAGPTLCHLGVRRLDERQRAILQHRRSPDVPVPLSPRRRKELRRQRRRLADEGALVYRSARSPAEIRRAAEQFMALEASGWKGRRGSALLHDPTLATFTRTMTRLMAHEGRCRIDSLEVGGRPVAMGILVTAGSQAYFWKTSFDERRAAQSPGVQFALDLTRAQAVEPGLTSTDSCAVPDHPMIDRIWTDRIGVADLVITLPHRAHESRAVQRALGLERLRRGVRQIGKRAYLRLRSAAPRWRGGDT